MCAPYYRAEAERERERKSDGLNMHNMAFIATKHLRTLLDSLMYPTRRKYPGDCRSIRCIRTNIDKFFTT